MKELPVVHEMSTIEDTLKQMCEARKNSAIVFDEYGGTVGLIMLEELEERFGYTFEFDLYVFTVIEMMENHVERVRLVIHPDVQEA